MPPLVAIAVAAFQVAAAVAPIAAVAVGAMAIVESQKARESGEKAVKKQVALRQEEMAITERQAGEYYELTAKQMEMQAQASQIRTLADLIERRGVAAPEPRILTLPERETYTPIEQINLAIDKIFRG